MVAACHLTLSPPLLTLAQNSAWLGSFCISLFGTNFSIPFLFMGSIGRCQPLKCVDCQTWSFCHNLDLPCDECIGARKFFWWVWWYRFPFDVSRRILNYLRNSWSLTARRCVYKMVLRQGPEPYPFQQIATQFVMHGVCKQCPMELILGFLVGSEDN